MTTTNTLQKKRALFRTRTGDPFLTMEVQPAHASSLTLPRVTKSVHNGATDTEARRQRPAGVTGAVDARWTDRSGATIALCGAEVLLLLAPRCPARLFLGLRLTAMGYISAASSPT